jgi:hypothetical protein
MRQFEPILLQHIDVFLQQLLKSSHAAEPVNMSTRCKRLGVDIIARFGFGYSLRTQTEETNLFVLLGLLGTSYKANVYMQAPMMRWFGLEFFFPILYALRMKYYFLLKRMVKERLALGKQAREDLFSYVMDAKDPETGTKISLGELVSEATFFFPAGAWRSSLRPFDLSCVVGANLDKAETQQPQPLPPLSSISRATHIATQDSPPRSAAPLLPASTSNPALSFRAAHTCGPSSTSPCECHHPSQEHSGASSP